MLRWLFLATGVAAFAIMIAVGSQFTLFLAFAIMFGNFATFCIQYDDANKRARARMKALLVGQHPLSEAHQRMDTAQIKTTQADRCHPMNAMTALNLTTGIANVSMLGWGIVLWSMS